jgi:uncharacterized protein
MSKICYAKNMIEDYIRYDKLIDDAMRDVVRKALTKVKEGGIPGGHHFLISFATANDGVEVPTRLRDKYPEEMTIVIQHQYEDLQILKNSFKIVLSFDSLKERITVPYDALTAFADPGVKFGLKFNVLSDNNLLDSLEEEMVKGKAPEAAVKEVEFKGLKKDEDKADKGGAKKVKAKKGGKKEKEGQNVVDLAAFRKKK